MGTWSWVSGSSPGAIRGLSSFEPETGDGSVPRNALGSFDGLAKRSGWRWTRPWAMKFLKRRRWCGASASSITITTVPSWKPPPRIPARAPTMRSQNRRRDENQTKGRSIKGYYRGRGCQRRRRQRHSGRAWRQGSPASVRQPPLLGRSCLPPARWRCERRCRLWAPPPWFIEFRRRRVSLLII